ncbi:MAG: DUF2442 domain-containing protein [Gammaproteobacteria bacterium]
METLKAGKWTYTEEELDRMFKDADRRGKEALKTEIQAHSASYDRKTNRLVLELKNGATLIVPCDLMQGLRDADPKDIAAVELGLRGASLHWEKLDMDFTVGGLVRGIFGAKKWMAELERSRGRAKSKTGTASANGKNGIRHRKVAAASPAKRGRKVA